jgi:RimJ/RimL family protein N-acetyltransferase
MLISEPKEIINDWVAERGGGRAHENSYRALAWVSEEEIQAGLVFYDFNPKNCLVNLAIKNNFFPKTLLKAGLFYAFNQLALRRLTFLISSVNIPSQNLVRRLGAIPEATLREADPSGDTLIFALFPENCKIWSRFNGKIVR